MSFHRLYYILHKFYRNIRRNPLTVGVRVILFKEPNQVLLIKHTYLPGWYLPGGGVKKNETLLDAAKREVFEEVGVEISSDPILIGVYSNLVERKSDHVVIFQFNEWHQGHFSNIEIKDAQLFPLDDLPADISPATLRRLKEAFFNAAKQPHW